MTDQPPAEQKKTPKYVRLTGFKICRGKQ